jgi:hypothetical protein
MTYPFDPKAQAARDAARQAFLDRRTCIANDEHPLETKPGENLADATKRRIQEVKSGEQSVDRKPGEDKAAAIRRRIKELKFVLKELGEEGTDDEPEADKSEKAQAARDSTYEAFMKRRHSQVPTMDRGRTEGAELMMDRAQHGNDIRWRSS